MHPGIWSSHQRFATSATRAGRRGRRPGLVGVVARAAVRLISAASALLGGLAPGLRVTRPVPFYGSSRHAPRPMRQRPA